MPFFRFFFPSRVTSHRDFFESNQTLLRLSQLSKVNTIDKVRTLQEHCPQRLPLNNPKPSPPSHDPLPRGKSRRRRTWPLHSISGAQLSTWHYLKFYPNKTWIINGGSHFLVRKYMEKSSPMASPLDQDSEDHHNPRGCRHHWNCQTSPFQETEVGGSSTTKKKLLLFDRQRGTHTPHKLEMLQSLSPLQSRSLNLGVTKVAPAAEWSCWSCVVRAPVRGSKPMVEMIICHCPARIFQIYRRQRICETTWEKGGRAWTLYFQVPSVFPNVDVSKIQLTDEMSFH